MKRRWLLQILQDNFKFWCPFKTGCSRLSPNKLFDCSSLKRYIDMLVLLQLLQHINKDTEINKKQRQSEEREREMCSQVYIFQAVILSLLLLTL